MRGTYAMVCPDCGVTWEAERTDEHCWKCSRLGIWVDAEES